MSKKSASETRSMPSRDDSFWASLFAFEETVLPSELDPQNIQPDDDLVRRIESPTVSSTSADWEEARTLFQNNDTLELSVNGFNKGGLLVEWKGLQGFVPASQLNDLPQFHIKTQRNSALKERLDQKLSLRIIEVDEKANRFILSERAATSGANDRETLFDRLAPGNICEGSVTNLTEFGAFVDLGGAEGLIHISELSWGRVMHPSDIVKPEQAVRVLILSIDRNAKRIALSLKQVEPDPWLTVEENYRTGQIVTGTVSNIANFGAFVSLGKGLEGLVHISELAEGSFLHPRNVVEKGQVVRGRILNVDAKSRRLALSLRQVPSASSNGSE